MTPKEQYAEYLKSNEWKQRAEQRRKIDGNKCWICGKEGERFHVHHKTYVNVYHENISDDLVTLCPDCHLRVHCVIDEFGELSNSMKERMDAEVTEIIKDTVLNSLRDVANRYADYRAELIAEATMKLIGDGKTKNLNSIVSYLEDALKLDSARFRMATYPAEMWKLLNEGTSCAFTLATQKISKRRGKKDRRG